MNKLLNNQILSEDRFRACFAENWSAVYRYLYSRGAGPNSEDLASEVFATAWRRWSDVPKDPLPWLLVTARNNLANHMRKSRYEAQLDDAVMTGSEEGLVVSAQLSEQLRELVVAVKKLPPLERELLLLVAWDGLTPAQAAKVVGCCAGTARARLFRARRRLKQYRPNRSMTLFITEEIATNA